MLYFPALFVAASGAFVVVISPFSERIRSDFVFPLTLVAAATTIFLFLRILFDAQCRRGIDAANAEIRGDRQWPSASPIKMSDPEWGLFGARTGTRALRVLRAVLLFEFVVALILSTRDGFDLLLLAGASFAVAVALSLTYIGLNTPAKRA